LSEIAVIKKFAENFEKVGSGKKSTSRTFSSIIGIPLTAEIVVEILCYGLNNENTEVI
jgi:hypothetical protein